MSATVKKTFYSSLVAGNPGVDELDSWSFQKLAADPATPAAGQEWLETTANRRRVRVNGVTQDYAFLTDLNQFGRYRGSFDASANALPTTAVLTTALGDQAQGQPINAGDEILISVATTGAGIVGLAAGSGVLQPGDILKAIADGATTVNY